MRRSFLAIGLCVAGIGLSVMFSGISERNNKREVVNYKISAFYESLSIETDTKKTAIKAKEAFDKSQDYYFEYKDKLSQKERAELLTYMGILKNYVEAYNANYDFEQEMKKLGL